MSDAERIEHRRAQKRKCKNIIKTSVIKISVQNSAACSKYSDKTAYILRNIMFFVGACACKRKNKS